MSSTRRAYVQQRQRAARTAVADNSLRQCRPGCARMDGGSRVAVYFALCHLLARRMPICARSPCCCCCAGAAALLWRHAIRWCGRSPLASRDRLNSLLGLRHCIACCSRVWIRGRRCRTIDALLLLVDAGSRRTGALSRRSGSAGRGCCWLDDAAVPHDSLPRHSSCECWCCSRRLALPRPSVRFASGAVPLRL